jgi:hypothetical protein
MLKLRPVCAGVCAFNAAPDKIRNKINVTLLLIKPPVLKSVQLRITQIDLEACRHIFLTIIKNTLRNTSSKKLHAQTHHQHIVHLADNRDEIRDELNRTEYIEDRASGNQLRVQRHLPVPKSPTNDPKFLKKPSDRDPDGFGKRPLRLPRESLYTNRHSARSFF